MLLFRMLDLVVFAWKLPCNSCHDPINQNWNVMSASTSAGAITNVMSVCMCAMKKLNYYLNRQQLECVAFRFVCVGLANKYCMQSSFNNFTSAQNAKENVKST